MENAMKSTRSQILVVMLMVVVVIVAGIVMALITLPSRHRDSTLSLHFPASIQQLVESSDEIFLGTVISGQYVGESQGFFVTTTPEHYELLIFTTSTPPPSMPTSTPTGVMMKPTWQPFALTRFVIRIDEIYYSRANLSVNQTIIMNRTGNINDYVTPTPGDPDDPDQDELIRSTLVMNQIGDQRLFFLMREVDGETYGAHQGSYSVLDIGGEYATIASSPPIAIDITEDARTVNLIQEIEDAISALPSPTPAP